MTTCCEYGWLSSTRCRRRHTVLVVSDQWKGGSPRCDEHAADMVDLLRSRGHQNVDIIPVPRKAGAQ